MSAPSLADLRHDQHEERSERWRMIRERTTRGLLLFNAGAVRHLEDVLFAVRSSRGGWWRVDYAGEVCECPDHEHRAGREDVACKHLVAVGVSLAARRSGVCEVREVGTAAGDPFRACGSRRLHELREIVRHELDEETRERARDELLRLTRRQLR